MTFPFIAPEIEIYRGDKCSFLEYEFQDDLGVARDLVAEGWTSWRAQWRTDRSSASDTFLVLTVDASLAASGIINVWASATVTRQIGTPGVWDLEAMNAGEPGTFVTGPTKVMGDVTR